jgi:tetratricopeptide (TPR) repeat protein
MNPNCSASRFGARILAQGLALVLAFSLTLPALAQDDEDGGRKTKQTVAMSQKVFEQLTEVQELMEAKQYSQGHTILRELLQDEKLSNYERAQIYNLSGYAYYLEERYPDAIRSYEQVMQQPELPEGLQQSTLKTLAQLHFTIDDYDAALETVRRLMAIVPEPSADVYMLLGQALFQKEDYRGALEPIETAISMYKDQGRVPAENWLLLLRVCYYELGDFQSMIGVLEQLILHYPKDTYVLTLAGVYSELGETKKQLALVEALYDGGLISNPTHIVNLANLYLLHETPFKAAQVMKRGMDEGMVPQDVRNLRLLSQAWYTAREDEKAIPPLRQAAEMSREGELYIRLAQSHINLEEWEEAAEAAETAIELGGLDREDQASIMLGMALFNQDKLSLARQAFERASRDNRSRRTAQQWIAYVESELKRKDLMSQDVAGPRDISDMMD